MGSVEFGARLQMSPYAAHQLIADAWDLEHRLPQLWRRVQSLEVKVSYARYVARKTRDPEPEQAAYVDSRVAEVADGRMTRTRFEDLVAAAVKSADPVAAAEREAKAAKESCARATRTAEHGATPTMPSGCCRTTTMRAPAGRLTHPTDLADLLPEVMLHVHCYAGPDPTGVVRVEGVGPDQRGLATKPPRSAGAVRVQPVLDIEGQAPVNGFASSTARGRTDRPHRALPARTRSPERAVQAGQAALSGDLPGA